MLQPRLSSHETAAAVPRPGKPAPRCPSLVQLVHNAAVVHSLLPRTSVPVVDSLKALLEKIVSVDFKDITPYQGFSADESALAHLSWTKGAMRLAWNGPVDDLVLLCPHRRTSIAVGLLHCPSIPEGESLSGLFEAFVASMEETYGHVLEMIVVCALDIGDPQLEDTNLAQLLQRGLEIFPPSTQLVDSGERAIDFHMRVVLSNACSRLVKSYNDLIAEADAAAKQLLALAMQRTPALTAIRPSSSSPPTAAAQAPSCRHPETCRLFSGSPTFANDQAPVLASATAASSQQSRKACKQLAARLTVWAGKHSLMVGSPLDAIARFETAVTLCRSVDDLVWEGLAHEGTAAARAAIASDGWGAVELMGRTLRADLDTALALYSRSLNSVAVRRLHTEASLRAAVVARTVDDLAAVLEYLQHARRVQSLHPALAWYLELEAGLWDRPPKRAPAKALLALAEAVDSYIDLGDFACALGVAERACAYVGVAALGWGKPALRLKAWLATGLLRRALHAVRKLGDVAPAGAFHFYASQLLPLLPPAQAEAGELLDEMRARSNGTVVAVGEAFAPYAARVVRIEAAPLKRSPPRLLASAAGEASAFIYSPFAPSAGDAAAAASRDDVLWVEGEPAVVRVELACPVQGRAVDVEVALAPECGVSAVAARATSSSSSTVVELGPFAVARGMTELKVSLRALGCEFAVRVPMPGVLAGLPLLEWDDDNGVRNAGPVDAILVAAASGGGGGGGGEQAMVHAGERVRLADEGDVAYTDAHGRVERVLASRKPLLLSARVTRADTADALKGAWGCALLQLRVPAIADASAIVDGDETQSWTPAALQSERVVPLRFAVVDPSELKARVRVDVGGVPAVWAASSKVLVASSAPPLWSAAVRVSVEPEDAAILHFVLCSVTAPGAPADARVEFVVFDTRGDRCVPLDSGADMLVWTGRPAAVLANGGSGGQGAHAAGLAVAQQGRFVVGCKLSDARTSWWAGFAALSVR